MKVLKHLQMTLPLLLLPFVAFAGEPPNLYDKVAAKLAADPALAARLGRAGPEMASVGWLLGEWDVVAEVTARSDAPEHGTSHVTTVLGGTAIELRDSYPSGTQDLGFISYSPATDSWTSIGLDSIGNAIATHGHATANGLVFEGDVVIVGVSTHLRQTIKREGERSYTLTNEERGSDGRWRTVDTYRYTRK